MFLPIEVKKIFGPSWAPAPTSPSINNHLPKEGCCILQHPLRFGLFQFKSAGIKLVVGSLGINQILMGAPFNDTALLQNHYAIRIADCGQPVGNDKSGPPLHQRIHTLLHQGFCSGGADQG